MADGKGMRVLIADDNRDTVMTLGILLRSEGFEVELAQGGSAVPELVRRFRPHAVLLDIGMPDRSGHDVALQLTREYGSDCPLLIAVTGRTADDEKRAAKVNGFRYYVPKPYDPERLLGLLGGLNPLASAA
jgi:DNA-binding response OmpR family regulator